MLRPCVPMPSVVMAITKSSMAMLLMRPLPLTVVFIYMLFHCDDGVKFSARTFQLPSCFRTTASCIGFYGRVEMPERLIVVRMPPASPKPKVAEYPLCLQ